LDSEGEKSGNTEKERLYSEKRKKKTIRNQKRDGRTVEKDRTEATEKKQTVPNPVHSFQGARKAGDAIHRQTRCPSNQQF
jgi:hypothetical protein